MTSRTPGRSAVVTIGAFTALVSMQLPAGSHQSPLPCNANDPGLNITKDRTWIRAGDVVTYTVEVHNEATEAGTPCDFTDAKVTVTLPAPDGTPTGEQKVIATGLDLPAGTGVTQLPPVTWTVALDPGVEDAVVRAHITGKIHDAQTDHAATVIKTLGTDVTAPFTVLTATASPPSGTAPLTVTFTYVEKNTGTSPITGIEVTDDTCSPVALTAGDNDGDTVLDVGETWTYTCTTTLTTEGTVTTKVKATGIDANDKRPHPEENASATVTVTAPVAPPQVLGEEVIRELPRTF